MVGLVFDTTLAIARMIYDGFFDRYRERARRELPVVLLEPR